MDEILRRFQHIGEQIFEELDNKSLAICRQADRSWKTFIDDQKFSWIRKIRFCSLDSKEPLEKILKKTKLDVVKELAEEGAFQNGFDLKSRKAGHILYFAAMIGHEEFFKEENISKFNVKNPDTLSGQTPLDFAAEYGNFYICQLIIQNLKAENPDTDGVLDYKDYDGSRYRNYVYNPLWYAYHEDRLDICKLIIENLKDKNPEYNEEGETALHIFAWRGRLDICEMIIKNISNKRHPSDYLGRTPFHDAASGGHLSICQLIIEYFDDKNPRDDECLTPLHIAAKNGNLAICKLIIENYSTSPMGLWGIIDGEYLTPLHIAAEKGNLAICKLIIKNYPTYPTGLWGKSPYHGSPYEKARANGHLDICKLFVENIDFSI